MARDCAARQALPQVVRPATHAGAESGPTAGSAGDAAGGTAWGGLLEHRSGVRCHRHSGSLFYDVGGWHSVVVGSIYSRLFALSYDLFLAWGERAGMQTLRRDALAEATGSVLEIGAGTGLNAAFFPADVERVTLSEPDPAMRHRLSQRLASLGRRHEILDAPADHLPVDSGQSTRW